MSVSYFKLIMLKALSVLTCWALISACINQDAPGQVNNSSNLDAVIIEPLTRLVLVFNKSKDKYYEH